METKQGLPLCPIIMKALIVACLGNQWRNIVNTRIVSMILIFVYFVRGVFRTKIICIEKVQSKSENPLPSVAVLKFHAYERSEIPSIRKLSAYGIFWIFVLFIAGHVHTVFDCLVLASHHLHRPAKTPGPHQSHAAAVCCPLAI